MITREIPENFDLGGLENRFKNSASKFLLAKTEFRVDLPRKSTPKRLTLCRFSEPLPQVSR